MRNLLLKVEVLAAVSAVAVISLYLLFPSGGESLQQDAQRAYPNQSKWRIHELERRVRGLSKSLEESERRVVQWEDSWPAGEVPEYYKTRHGLSERVTKPGADGSINSDAEGRSAKSSRGDSKKREKVQPAGNKPGKRNTAYQKKKRNVNGSLGTSGTSSQMAAGLLGLYYQGRKFEELKLVMTDYEVDFDFADRSPDRIILEDNFSIRWEGTVKIENEADYTFHTLSDDGVKLRVAGRLVINNWGDHAATLNSGKIHLKKGNYPIRLDFYERGGSAVIKLYWSSNKFSMEIIPSAYLFHNPDAAEAARKKVQ